MLLVGFLLVALVILLSNESIYTVDKIISDLHSKGVDVRITHKADKSFSVEIIKTTQSQTQHAIFFGDNLLYLLEKALLNIEKWVEGKYY